MEDYQRQEMSRPTVLNLTFRFVAILWAILSMVPWDPGPFALAPEDGAYTIFSHTAFAEGRPWGSAALHTGGPLSFLRYGVLYPPTYLWLIAGNAAIAVCIALLLDHLAARRLGPWLRVSFLLLAITMLSISDEAKWLFVLLAPSLVIPELSQSARWSLRPGEGWLSWPLVLSLAACALAANVKGTYLVMAGVLAAELAFLESRSRRLPLMSASLIVSVVALAGLSGFGILDWGPYAKHVIDSLTGYPEAFSVAGSLPRAAILLSSAVALCLASAPVHTGTCRLEALVRWAAPCVIIWINVKSSLVRQDQFHELRAILSLGVFLAAYTIVHRPRSVWSKALSIASAVGFAALFLFATTPSYGIQRSFGQFASFLRQGTASAQARYRESARRVAAEIQRPCPPESTIAAFGSYQSPLLGYPCRRIELPIVASYEIWSPWTSRREQEFFLSSKAPEYLLYTASPADAGLALVLSTRYAEIERSERYRLLRRRPVVLPSVRHLVLEKEIGSSERIELGREWRDGPVIAEVRYEKRFAAVLLSALYQPPEALLVLYGGETPVTKLRMNPLLSGEGMVLSSAPGVWDGRAEAVHGIRFGLLTDERTQAEAIGFEANGPAGRQWDTYFEPRLRVRLYVLEFGDARRGLR